MSKSRFIVQRVHIVWSKASRGGEGARRRRALAKAFPLPLECFAAPFTIHRVSFGELDSFETAVNVVTRGHSFTDLGIRDLQVEFRDGSAQIELIRDPQNAAIADRTHWDSSGNVVNQLTAFTLLEGEWGQLEYNGRYVDRDTGNWWYEQSVYNIGLLREISTERFTGSRPDKRFVELATLR